MFVWFFNAMSMQISTLIFIFYFTIVYFIEQYFNYVFSLHIIQVDFFLFIEM